MNRKWYPVALMILSLAAASWSASVLQDLRFSCSTSTCQMVFSFRPGSALPSYYQKYDVESGNLRIAFSETEFAVAEGELQIDATSPWIRSVKVSRDLQRNPRLLYIDLASGKAVSGDRNPTALRGKTDFIMEFPVKGHGVSRPWDLKVLSGVKKKQPSGSAISSPRPAVSANGVFTPSLQEIAVLKGNGLEQVALHLPGWNDLNALVSHAEEIRIPLSGPSSSTSLKVESSLARAVYWNKGDLVIALSGRQKPTLLLKGERLILQSVVENSDNLESWTASAAGVRRQSWALPARTETVEDLEAFARNRHKSAVLATGSGTIQVKKREGQYIVVEEGAALYAEASDKSSILLHLSFGEPLTTLEQSGLFYKVKVGDRTGFVNRRQISLDTELSVSQRERLLRLMQPGQQADGYAVRFEAVDDDLVTYSSFGRRDPFIEIKGVIDEAINIDQTELVGIIWESDVPIALLTDTKIPGVSYTLREGDPILNGKVLKITQNDVLFQIHEFGVSRRYSMTLPDRYGGKK